MATKTYISITGTTGAGKSTLLQALKNSMPLNSQLVRQTTTRFQREDDDPLAFNYLSEDSFNKELFFLVHNRYGITQNDFDVFLKSDKDVGISINGANEIKQIKFVKELNEGVSYVNILVTFCNSLSSEIKKLESEVFKLFKGKQAKERLLEYSEICEAFFFNQGYLSDNIDLHLNRQDDCSEWANKILAKMPMLLTTHNNLNTALINEIKKCSRKS